MTGKGENWTFYHVVKVVYLNIGRLPNPAPARRNSTVTRSQNVVDSVISGSVAGFVTHVDLIEGAAADASSGKRTAPSSGGLVLEDNSAVSVDNVFVGKVVLIYLTDASDDFAGGIAIRDPRIENFNGLLFVTGVVPTGYHDWSSGQRIGVAFDQIAHFLEFEDEQEFMEKSAFAFQGPGTGPPTQQ